jgi:hypothetical protein
VGLRLLLEIEKDLDHRLHLFLVGPTIPDYGFFDLQWRILH